MQTGNWEITKRAEFIKAQLIDWRRHLHRFPELSFEERKTSEFIINVLEQEEVFAIQTGVAGYGIVATLSGGEGPVIGVRADMDALPIQEQTGVEYQSEHPGVMHACGHDAHITMVLGVAKLLAEDYRQGKVNGTVKLIFQPAEEAADEHGLTGAPYLLRSGAINDLDAAIALHVCPWRNTGELQINKGPSMANIDNFELEIIGTGGHGGYPHQGTDPIWITSYVLQGLYSVISRKINPLDVGTISVGEIHAGHTANVIPKSVTIKGTMRSYTDVMRRRLIEELESIAKVTESMGGKYQLSIEHGEPALDNDEEVIDIFREIATSIYPNMPIYEEPYGMGGEDFGHITKQVKGAMFFLGCASNGDTSGSLHTSTFQINEDALPIGVSLLTASTHRLLKQG
ncbi:M20 metallopeptidase family protein [Aquibacillus salsiterrae]|uniref:Amidohydrolase n=1 Tax=Aquibacillus salsiterrae TaxID=2950439 RepID=A0A9X3WEE9_9BACI|nr:amidohydrolase [Aquibacillus salsiterrae]MDC3416931.1 amidohydrolase [Aquibacillus salsiterrae]